MWCTNLVIKVGSKDLSFYMYKDMHAGRSGTHRDMYAHPGVVRFHKTQ